MKTLKHTQNWSWAQIESSLLQSRYRARRRHSGIVLFPSSTYLVDWTLRENKFVDGPRQRSFSAHIRERLSMGAIWLDRVGWERYCEWEVILLWWECSTAIIYKSFLVWLILVSWLWHFMILGRAKQISHRRLDVARRSQTNVSNWRHRDSHFKGAS